MKLCLFHPLLLFMDCLALEVKVFIYNLGIYLGKNWCKTQGYHGICWSYNKIKGFDELTTPSSPSSFLEMGSSFVHVDAIHVMKLQLGEGYNWKLQI